MIDNASQVVLPDTLVAQLIGDAATLSRYLLEDFNRLLSQRDRLRQRLLSENQIVDIQIPNNPLQKTFAIDGAHLAEIDRASAYSASCAVCVGQADQVNRQSSCLTTLPHVACLNALSSGFMMMQEIMMAVEVIESDPNIICLIDGSRISAIINIQSFYSGIARDLAGQLNQWRDQSRLEADREPGRIIRLFECRDWMTPYLSNPRIVGNLKLVTTSTLIERYAPEWVGRFDDKTFASLILEPGEAIQPIPISTPDEPFHIHNSYPYSQQMDQLNSHLTMVNNPSRIFHIYYRPDASHGVYKIELNGTLLSQEETIKGLFSWWQQEIDAPDLQEPYSFFIADRFAKEAVSVAKNALKEIARRELGVNSQAWSFTQPYRTV